MVAKIDNLKASDALRDAFNGKNVATYPDGAVIVDREVIDELYEDSRSYGTLTPEVHRELQGVDAYMVAEGLTYITLHP